LPSIVTVRPITSSRPPKCSCQTSLEITATGLPDVASASVGVRPRNRLYAEQLEVAAGHVVDPHILAPGFGDQAHCIEEIAFQAWYARRTLQRLELREEVTLTAGVGCEPSSNSVQ
jgi:hypothetical protein